MPSKKKRAPHIPPGAPGHPKAGSGEAGSRASKARAPRLERPETAASPRGGERPAARAAPRRPTAARLVYEDDSILAFDKPVGLPVIAPEGSRSRCLLDLATEQVMRTHSKGRAAVVHRIDRDTSGIVIFAADGRTKKLLMDNWDELVAERLYVALVEGSMAEGSGAFDSWLKENKAGEVYRAEPKEKGAKRAVTRWRVIGKGAGLSLLELALETGRKHQIRVQLADSGHPVVGDERYGTGRDDLGRLALHARAIELRLPGREPLRIDSPPPPEFEAAIKAVEPERRLPEEPRRRLNDKRVAPPKISARRGDTEAPPKISARRGDTEAPPKTSARRGGASASRSGVRNGARPRPPSPRGK
jgi:23S rRNA pseudouridine1911/1915/1917 synthase